MFPFRPRRLLAVLSARYSFEVPACDPLRMFVLNRHDRYSGFLFCHVSMPVKKPIRTVTLSPETRHAEHRSLFSSYISQSFRWLMLSCLEFNAEHGVFAMRI